MDWQTTSFHHDGKRLPKGDAITLEEREDSSGTDTWEGFNIRVFDPITDVVKYEVASQPLVDSGALPIPAPNRDDPYHANWVSMVQTQDGPEIYVSVCDQRTILAIDPVTNDALWQLGVGRGWTWTGPAIRVYN